jgi:CheY-like chemotaxis protein
MERGNVTGQRSRRAEANGPETILLVEDEPQVRELFKRILESCGYRVLDAADGERALSICRLHEGEIHLAVVDVVMPEMGGPELVQRLAPTRPAMKVIYVSGYGESLVSGRLDPGAVYVQKPITVGGLAKKVRDVLDAR